MVKKILSVLGIVGILSSMVVSTAFAEDGVLTLSADTLTIVEAGDQKVTISFTKAQGVNVTTLAIKDGTAVVKNLNDPTCPVDDTDCSVEWTGKDNAGVEVAAKAYNVVLDLDDGKSNTKPLTVKKDLWVKTFNTADLNWDPAKGGLSLAYELSKAATSVGFDVSFNGKSVKASSHGSVDSGTYTWDGKVSDDLVFPGTYMLKLTATAEGKTVTKEKKLIVVYEDAGKPGLTLLEPDTDDEKTFNSDTEEVKVSFKLDNTAYVSVEIWDKDEKVVYSPAQLDGTDDYSNETLDFDWDGSSSTCGFVPTGDYKVVIIARNDLGVAVDDSVVLKITSAESKCQQAGSLKMKVIDITPGGDWDPLEEELEIEWEITVEDFFDSFTIEARKGGKVVEIYEGDTDEGKDSFDFEGKDDDDEYLEQGDWTLLFLGKKDTITYYVEDGFTIKYQKPGIDEVLVTKDEIDPDLGEGVYFVFKLEDDAKVYADVLRGTTSKVDLLGEEGEEVEKDLWYAVYWDGLKEDGGDFHFDDEFKIRLEVCSLGSDDACVTQSKVVDLKEDDVTSTKKSNITLDLLVPPVVEEGGDVELTFNIEDDAKVKVAIWEGSSTSGSADVVLMDYTLVPSGDYKFAWDTRDEDGDAMDDGYYSYKIFTQKEGSSSTEAETGKFIIGEVGDIFGGPSETAASDDEASGGSSLLDNPYLVLEGDEEEEEEEEEEAGEEVSFADVLPSNVNYEAIMWTASEGIFEGDASGEFRPYDGINRAEVLAVVMRAFDLTLYPDDGTTLGWSDVIPGAWYMGYLRSGKLLGLLSGDGNANTVRPSDPVKRVEFLKFLYEGAELSGVTVVPACTYNPYADVTIGNWYTDYVCQSKLDNLFTVVGDLFLPAVEASRGEVAEAIYRLLGN